MVADIAPGSVGSDPNNLTEVDGTLFFSAEEPIRGRELWALALEGACCFVTESCADASTVPACRLDGGIFQGHLSACTQPCAFGANGDIDRNGHIDLFDFRVFVGCTSQHLGKTSDACRLGFDLDGNFTIDLADFAVFQNTFGGSP